MNRTFGPDLDEQCFDYPFPPDGLDPQEDALQGLQAQEDPHQVGTLIVQGTWAAEAARTMFPHLAVIGCRHSAGDPETWAPLAGRRDLVLWPSLDQAGKIFAQAVHRGL